MRLFIIWIWIAACATRPGTKDPSQVSQQSKESKLTGGPSSNIYYHATLARNLQSILANGLDPSFGGTGASERDESFEVRSKSKIHITDSIHFARYYGAFLSCREEASPVILQMNVDDDFIASLKIDPDELHSYTTDSKIDPSAISVLAGEGPFPCLLDARDPQNPKFHSNVFYFVFTENKQKERILSKSDLLKAHIASPNWRTIGRFCLEIKEGIEGAGELDEELEVEELGFMYMGKLKFAEGPENFKAIELLRGPEWQLVYDDERDTEFVDNGEYELAVTFHGVYRVLKKGIEKVGTLSYQKVPCEDGMVTHPVP